MYTATNGDKYTISFALDRAYLESNTVNNNDNQMVTIPDLVPLPVPPLKPPTISSEDYFWGMPNSWSENPGDTNSDDFTNIDKTQRDREIITTEPYIIKE